ncbi:hypothetical protein N7535_008089 [Penicillium sp. DV-2018c]|nr:hypothetical protein N7461_004125 [Penicillium sp. DV-2018c]KAJ5566451.1 hypothetical protein N7535_008089 [Penicillium sp. DV-2018c]
MAREPDTAFFPAQPQVEKVTGMGGKLKWALNYGKSTGSHLHLAAISRFSHTPLPVPDLGSDSHTQSVTLFGSTITPLSRCRMDPLYDADDAANQGLAGAPVR